MNAQPATTLLTSLHAAENQLKSLERHVSETYADDRKMAWCVTGALNYLTRLKTLMVLGESPE